MKINVGKIDGNKVDNVVRTNTSESDRTKDCSDKGDGTDEGVYVQSRHDFFVHLLHVKILELSIYRFMFHLHKHFLNNDVPLNIR